MALRDDTHYITLVLGGDMAAFRVLVDRHKDLVYTIVLKISRNREDAEELAQDVFVKAFQGLSSFRQESSFATWLYRIAFNEAINKFRKKGQKMVSLEEETTADLADYPAEDEDDGLTREEKYEAIQEAMAVLPEPDQVLMTLFYTQDMPVREISEVTGLSESNVKVRLHRARLRLASALKEAGRKNPLTVH
jgi:RNA polymerase sigma-70 factor (ECF subfamily)